MEVSKYRFNVAVKQKVTLSYKDKCESKYYAFYDIKRSQGQDIEISVSKNKCLETS
jgi:hypothetical protein